MVVRWIRLKFAEHIRNRMQKQLVSGKVSLEDIAEKWNYIQGVIVTKGRVKIRWDKILRKL